MLEKKHIVILSGISGILHLITCIALAIVWTYWSDTLNSCAEGTCACIFYGQLRGSSFVGGRPIWCRTLTYFTLLASIVSFIIAVYYFTKIRSEPKNFSNRATQSDGNISRTRHKAKFSIGFKVVCGSIALLTFIHACALSEGYLTTCKEYKSLVARHLKAGGDLSDLINDRLSCGTMYDFLDYLHPDVIARNPYLPQYYHHRTFRIDTGTILFTSILFSWLNVILWSLMTVLVGFCR